MFLVNIHIQRGTGPRLQFHFLCDFSFFLFLFLICDKWEILTILYWGRVICL
ncbi:hypothetical protein BDV27DRAFT_122832 [Aspergillus caelatus]|uniref:Uncharacterized protein n=1 Tax=Aspergillus caelatus TaxID=61420 RepID=A0A5N7AE34_9EURO|nr:uncharacterized protein BDV27DRAFT_122832 [Aspergillus caelatus]KAE8368131.1 hypothetical protein BDV27DRAFT_122832 [Aspergillus caelatus]